MYHTPAPMGGRKKWMGDVAGHGCVLSEQSHYVKVR